MVLLDDTVIALSDLKGGREHVEDHRGEHKVYSSSASVDYPVQSPRLSAQVEAMVQTMKVHKHLAGHVTNCVLRHVGEDGVAHLCATPKFYLTQRLTV